MEEEERRGEGGIGRDKETRRVGEGEKGRRAEEDRGEGGTFKGRFFV